MLLLPVPLDQDDALGASAASTATMAAEQQLPAAAALASPGAVGDALRALVLEALERRAAADEAAAAARAAVDDAAALAARLEAAAARERGGGGAAPQLVAVQPGAFAYPLLGTQQQHQHQLLQLLLAQQQQTQPQMQRQQALALARPHTSPPPPPLPLLQALPPAAGAGPSIVDAAAAGAYALLPLGAAAGVAANPALPPP